jgi:small nuclear ribonucleoprotein (snRNP)-like protein
VFIRNKKVSLILLLQTIVHGELSDFFMYMKAILNTIVMCITLEANARLKKKGSKVECLSRSKSEPRIQISMREEWQKEKGNLFVSSFS